MDGIKVGALAEQSGLTVRTLHHYDQVGLVSPSARTSAGHRLYVDADVDRLYRVVVLRQLGLSIPVVKDLLAGSLTLREVLHRQRAYLTHRIGELTRLETRVAGLLAESDGPRSTDLLEVVRKVTTMDAMMSKYFDDNQMSQLDRRRAAIGDDAIRKVEQAWPGLIARVDAAVAEGLDPASAQARQLADEWAGLLEGFHGGDEGLRDSLFRMYEENSAQIEEQSGGPSAAALQFITAVEEARGDES
ncbi:MerR family transcriptional regulator [Rhodococcus triatomae]|uniref:DNA-binding transcriptional regulator, MerR family n=1 Tax=Rhodococcus triatomae TaxID=300028 RepID=A0A1G8QWG2_9NOCA|nr:MerR family transcriptional regulator [Rhodococcus triatomae]QNG20767.1 MerR family transcriptional regulator [Rhodococcus triatomae]QNG23317.1 MerR family transcriptional regulator [Rhodococcus triatomae]SDJ09036.1 DNA-binding transcriptional regulator, MerR family [Rhodococcus triatomae]